MTPTLDRAINTFKEKFKISGKIREEGIDYIPGGYSRHSFNYGPHAIYVDRGDRQYLYTADGHQLLDFHNNFTTGILGHNHPKIKEALIEAIPNGFCFGNPMKHEFKLAKMLCERIDAVERVIFSCSASESCLSAIRIARANTGKNKIAKLEGGYHGLGDEFMISLHPFPDAFSGPPLRPIPTPSSAGIPQHIRQNVVILPQNDLNSCQRILKENAGDLACVILELQSGAGGLIVLDKEFVQGIRQTTLELGILLIIDETITLRINFSGLQSSYGIKPDLVVLGKMIGGGLPIGAVAGKEKYFRMQETGKVFHSGTHHGHPLATKAGIACLEVMNEATYDRLNEYGDRIKTELNAWAKEKEYSFIVHGEGSFLGYEFTDRPGREYKSCRDIIRYSNEEQMQIFALEMVNRGIFPMYRGQLTISEPMTVDDIEIFISNAKSTIEAIFE